MPPGLITGLLLEAEARGRDGTGVGYRDDDRKSLETFKSDDRACVFTQSQKTQLRNARMGRRGILHTRNASRGMPINSRNAHPFTYLNFVFAHNGRVDHWKTFREREIANTELELEQLDHQDKKLHASLLHKLSFLEDATTDSMILGPLIAQRNFTPVSGSFGLTWLHGENVYVMHSCKELTGFQVEWSHKPNNGCDSTPRSLTIAASTAKIVNNAFARTKVDYKLIELDLTEDHVYRLEPDAIYDEGEIPTNSNNGVDNFTSQELSSSVR